MTGTEHIQAMNIQNKKDWETPEWLVRGIEHKWGITFALDACARDDNTKAPKWITPEQNALTSMWVTPDDKAVWVNPPYGEVEIRAFIQKALESIARETYTVVFLIPNATENTIWHTHIFPKAAEICFIEGRISFEANGAPQPGNTRGSVLIFYQRDHVGPPKLSWVKRDELRGPKRARLGNLVT